MSKLPQLQSTSSEIVPSGSYQAQLSQVRQFSNAHGERLAFEFTLKNHPVTGCKVLCSTSTHLSVSGKLAQTLQGILGKKLSKNDLTKGVDFDTLLGRDCIVMVSQGQNKSGAIYSKVDGVFPIVVGANTIA